MSDTATVAEEATATTATAAEVTTAADVTTDTTTVEQSGTIESAEGAAAATDETPVEITLQAPADSPLDAAVLERTAAIARELGLSQEQAQRLVEPLTEAAQSTRDALLESYAPGGAAWTAQEQAWAAESLADPEIGGTPEKLAASLALAQEPLKRFGDDAVRAFLGTTGLASNPAALRFLVRIGKAMSEGTFVAPGAAHAIDEGEAKLRALYPTMYGEKKD